MLKNFLLTCFIFAVAFSYVHSNYFSNFLFKREECKQVIIEKAPTKPLNTLPLIPEKIS